MPTPVLNCPPAPQAGSVGAAPGQGAVPGMGVFNMERGKLKLPLSRSLQMFHTALPAMLLPGTLFLVGSAMLNPPSFAATAAVQLVNPAQYAGFKAASKNGCGVSAFGFMTLEWSPPHFPAARRVAPPQCCQTI